MVKRVLHIIPSMSAGGIESAIISVYQNIDRNKIQFDFAVFNPNNPIHDQTVKRLGGNVYYIANAGCNSSIWSKILWRIKAVSNLNKLLQKHHYDVVHCHAYSSWLRYALIAKIHHVKKIVVHCHNSDGDSFLDSINNRFLNLFEDKLIDNKIGCSEQAYKWLFKNRKRACDQTIYNGVSLSKFNKVIYDKIPIMQNYHINQDAFNIITIGRFSVQKNQGFLIEAFSELCKKNIDKTVHLHIVGFGSLENELKSAVKRSGLKDRVTFYPYNTNIPELLSCMDCFVLPSKYEGFGIVLIEAQAMNLPCIVSERVTKESNVGLCKYISIDDGTEIWANTLEKIINGKIDMTLNPEKLGSFDIPFITKQYERLYKSV